MHVTYRAQSTSHQLSSAVTNSSYAAVSPLASFILRLIIQIDFFFRTFFISCFFVFLCHIYSNISIEFQFSASTQCCSAPVSSSLLVIFSFYFYEFIQQRFFLSLSPSHSFALFAIQVQFWSAVSGAWHKNWLQKVFCFIRINPVGASRVHSCGSFIVFEFFSFAD